MQPNEAQVWSRRKEAVQKLRKVHLRFPADGGLPYLPGSELEGAVNAVREFRSSNEEMAALLKRRAKVPSN